MPDSEMRMLSEQFRDVYDYCFAGRFMHFLAWLVASAIVPAHERGSKLKDDPWMVSGQMCCAIEIWYGSIRPLILRCNCNGH